MPYVSKVITPTQYKEPHTIQQSQFYKGFSTIDPSASDVRLYDYNLIKQDILNQFNIRKGERVMLPDFGTVVWDLLYEPFTDATKSAIADDVVRIVASDPRADALEVKVIEQEYGMLLEVTLLYRNTNQTDVMKLQFDKTVGLLQV